MVFAGLCAVIPALAQVDGGKPSQDTLYIIEEQVSYDTLYLYDTLPDYELMSKDELIEAFRRDRGIGKLYYQRGHLYLTGADELYKMDDKDLQAFLSASDYADWCKAKHNRNVSIPLYVAGCGTAACAGLGLYQFVASFLFMTNNGDLILQYDDLGPKVMRCAFSGFFLFAGGALATAAFVAPAAVFTIKSKRTVNRIVEGVNAPPTSMQLRAGPASGGVGLTLSF